MDSAGISPRGAAMIIVPTTIRPVLDDILSVKQDFEFQMTERLCDGFATPPGTIFWFRYLSHITPEAVDLVVAHLAKKFEFEVRRDCVGVLEILYWAAHNYKDRTVPAWTTRSKFRTAFDGCEFAFVGCSKSRDRRTLREMIEKIGVSSHQAKLIADPELLRHHFDGYIALLVRANNAIAEMCGKNIQDATTEREIEMIRNHDFSEASMQKISESPIAVTYIARLEMEGV